MNNFSSNNPTEDLLPGINLGMESSAKNTSSLTMTNMEALGSMLQCMYINNKLGITLNLLNEIITLGYQAYKDISPMLPNQTIK